MVQDNKDSKITLYHHSDGYPTNMLEEIKDAYEQAIARLRKELPQYPQYFKLRWTGSMASFLSAENPTGFEQEKGNALHGDIEWYYVIKPKKMPEGEEIPEWEVTVYKVTGRDEDQKLIPIVRDEVRKAAKAAEKIEEIGNKKGDEEYEKMSKKKARA